MNALRPAHGRLELRALRQMAASRSGRTRLQNLLAEYRARRASMTRHDQVTHDIAAARVRYALDEARVGAVIGDPVIRLWGDAA